VCAGTLVQREAVRERRARPCRVSCARTAGVHSFRSTCSPSDCGCGAAPPLPLVAPATPESAAPEAAAALRRAATAATAAEAAACDVGALGEAIAAVPIPPEPTTSHFLPRLPASALGAPAPATGPAAPAAEPTLHAGVSHPRSRPDIVPPRALCRVCATRTGL
jgi:hypothetical protein